MSAHIDWALDNVKLSKYMEKIDAYKHILKPFWIADLEVRTNNDFNCVLY